ncbi:MAG: SsrA-binding protein SmpB [Proteobacteria bacterium]|nr:SsrA-binding protein SmpB [Pseudomonadota bacterium]
MADKAVKLISQNRKAFHDYHIEKTIEAGLVLKGSEVKSCREGKVQLVDSFASFSKGELFLHKANISEFKQGGPFYNHPPVRTRKLLLKKKELQQLLTAIDKDGYTLIPIKIYFKNGYAKIELGLAKGKTRGDKRDTLKKKEVQRSMDQAKRRDR